MKHKLAVSKPNTVTLLLLISYATVSAVLFAPGLPQMSAFFAVSSSSIQFAVVAFLFAYAYRSVRCFFVHIFRLAGFVRVIVGRPVC